MEENGVFGRGARFELRYPMACGGCQKIKKSALQKFSVYDLFGNHDSGNGWGRIPSLPEERADAERIPDGRGFSTEPE